jgi:hypothetical protein
MRSMGGARFAAAVVVAAFTLAGANGASGAAPKRASRDCGRGSAVLVQKVRERERRHGKTVWITVTERRCVGYSYGSIETAAG